MFSLVLSPQGVAFIKIASNLSDVFLVKKLLSGNIYKYFPTHDF